MISSDLASLPSWRKCRQHEPNFPKANTFFAWCVRGGQGVDPQ